MGFFSQVRLYKRSLILNFKLFIFIRYWRRRKSKTSYSFIKINQSKLKINISLQFNLRLQNLITKPLLIVKMLFYSIKDMLYTCLICHCINFETYRQFFCLDDALLFRTTALESAYTHRDHSSSWYSSELVLNFPIRQSDCSLSQHHCYGGVHKCGRSRCWQLTSLF